jgi:protease-4
LPPWQSSAAARRWKIFFRLAWLLVFAVLVERWAALDQSTSGASKLAPHTAVVDIKGEIAAGAEASAELWWLPCAVPSKTRARRLWCC